MPDDSFGFEDLAFAQMPDVACRVRKIRVGSVRSRKGPTRSLKRPASSVIVASDPKKLKGGTLANQPEVQGAEQPTSSPPPASDGEAGPAGSEVIQGCHKQTNHLFESVSGLCFGVDVGFSLVFG